MSTSDNNPTTRHVVKFGGIGNQQVFPNFPTMINGPQDGSDVGTGGPATAGVETSMPDGQFISNRAIEFLDDIYVLAANGQNSNIDSGVYKRNKGGDGQWGRVQGGSISNIANSTFAGDSECTGLHVLHNDGVPTLFYMMIDANENWRIWHTTNGISGANWSTGTGTQVEINTFGPISHGQSIMFGNTIVHAHQHYTTGAAGIGAITQYDLETSTLTRYNVSSLFEPLQLASNYSLHVHDNALFLFGFDATTVGGAGGGGDPGRFARVAKLQGGTFQTVWTSTTIQYFAVTINGHAPMFTDPDTGDLVVIVHGADSVTGNSTIQVVSIENATTVPNVTDITTTVLGPGPNPTSGDGAEKYRLTQPDWRRRWSVFVDSSDALNPHTFLTTWGPSTPISETWEWIGIDADMCPVEAGTGGQQGISDDFALPYITASGGERSPRTGAVELEGVPERAIGGTKFEFRGRRNAAGIVTFYGDNGLGAGTPAVQLPIMAGSLIIGPGFFTNLESYYHLENSGAARVDSSPHARHLDPWGSTPVGVGKFGNGLSNDGSQGRLGHAADFNAVDFPGAGTTYGVSCWYNATAIVATGTLVGKTNNDSNGWMLQVLANGAVRWRNGGVGSRDTPADVITVTSGFQHIIATSDGTTLKIYVDGVEQYSGIPLIITDSSQVMEIGTHDLSNDPMNGVIDEVAVWSRYITPIEVGYLYNGDAGFLLEGVTPWAASTSISGNTIINFACDDGITPYSVILDAANAGITPGAPGIIMADLTQLG